jgi:hypothetical protein
MITSVHGPFGFLWCISYGLCIVSRANQWTIWSSGFLSRKEEKKLWLKILIHFGSSFVDSRRDIPLDTKSGADSTTKFGPLKLFAARGARFFMVLQTERQKRSQIGHKI